MISQLIAAAAAAGVRTSLTLLALGIAARAGMVATPAELAWVESDLGLSLLLAFAVLEHFTETSEDLQAISETANYALRGAGGALVGATLELGGVAEALPPAAKAMLGAAVAVGTHHLRSRVHAALRGLGDDLQSPRTWLVWLENGGVVGLLVALVLAPPLALAFVIMASAGSLGAVALARALEDRRHRRSCPGCGARARKEASRCPACGVPLEILRRR